ncbi:MAG: hypothetical protein K1X54_07805 [Flavobacteriales bacterium]|nr:hypothetical protein [Flavobacteriales bacterium]
MTKHISIILQTSAVIAVIILLSSCGGSKMIFAKYGKFSMEEGELNHFPVGQQEVAAYQNCCFVESDQIYLNRCVVHDAKQYAIFIAVSETLTQSTYADALQSDASFQIIEKKSAVVRKTKVDAYLISRGNSHTARFTYMEHKGGLMVIYDYTTTNLENAKSIYDTMETYLHEKIHL